MPGIVAGRADASVEGRTRRKSLVRAQSKRLEKEASAAKSQSEMRSQVDEDLWRSAGRDKTQRRPGSYAVVALFQKFVGLFAGLAWSRFINGFLEARGVDANTRIAVLATHAVVLASLAPMAVMLSRTTVFEVVVAVFADMSGFAFRGALLLVVVVVVVFGRGRGKMRLWGPGLYPPSYLSLPSPPSCHPLFPSSPPQHPPRPATLTILSRPSNPRNPPILPPSPPLRRTLRTLPSPRRLSRTFSPPSPPRPGHGAEQGVL